MANNILHALENPMRTKVLPNFILTSLKALIYIGSLLYAWKPASSSRIILWL